MEIKINIFYIDECPIQCAVWMVDKHVVKMILESAQLLSTAHRIVDGVEYEGKSQSGRKARRWVLPDARENVIYSATHINHPSAVWARTSVSNYNWLVDHFFALISEYNYRYEKHHKCYGDISYMLQSPPHNLRDYDFTPMPSCMDKQYIVSDDPITNYRNYYNKGKSRMFNWKKRNPPPWIQENTL
jgi:hypothetical protein